MSRVKLSQAQEIERRLDEAVRDLNEVMMSLATYRAVREIRMDTVTDDRLEGRYPIAKVEVVWDLNALDPDN